MTLIKFKKIEKCLHDNIFVTDKACICSDCGVALNSLKILKIVSDTQCLYGKFKISNLKLQTSAKQLENEVVYYKQKLDEISQEIRGLYSEKDVLNEKIKELKAQENLF